MPPRRVGEVPFALEEGERILVPVDDAESVYFRLVRAGSRRSLRRRPGPESARPLQERMEPLLRDGAASRMDLLAHGVQHQSLTLTPPPGALIGTAWSPAAVAAPS